MLFIIKDRKKPTLFSLRSLFDTFRKCSFITVYTFVMVLRRKMTFSTTLNDTHNHYSLLNLLWNFVLIFCKRSMRFFRCCCCCCSLLFLSVSFFLYLLPFLYLFLLLTHSVYLFPCNFIFSFVSFCTQLCRPLLL